MNLIRSTLNYPASETPKLEALHHLFRDWIETSVQLSPELKDRIEGMVFDGFYPHYFSKKIRVLFIGREAREIEGYNYLDLLHTAYRTGKRIGSQHLNCNLFHRRMLYVTYGILNDFPEWRAIPDADLIGNDFATQDGTSFAFMNLSKFSNESEFWPSNWTMIQESVRLATQERNFIAEEIALLEPDVVIAMNLKHYFSSLGEEVTELPSAGGAADAWILKSHGHKSLLLNSFHFSAPGKRDLEHFYLPLQEAVQSHMS